jgi:hypothetical protein
LSEYYNGPETIFAYQASSNDGEPNGNNANYGERLNFPHSGSPFGCCGFHQGSQNLVNFFKVDGSGLPLAVSTPSQVFDATAAWNAQDGEFDSSFNIIMYVSKIVKTYCLLLDELTLKRIEDLYSKNQKYITRGKQI